MDSNILLPEIYVRFSGEWQLVMEDMEWGCFVISLDLGVICDPKASASSDWYIVVDEKKWFLNRLKYGF